MNRVTMAGLLFLTGCMSQSGFYDEFVPTYCEYHDACNTSGLACAVTLTDAEPASDCDFDAKAARECLEGPFECDETINGFEVVVAPAACEASRICGAGQ